ncbi:metallophosphoesterase [Caballeronia sp. EK]|uniref:metallophosphoesterase family protein n=1 Tax=Caballeronia sp. EK TaxID=2767469 RepID=UPI0016558823|nr:metallophosphoesterase [Caballeronia sp. EK]MBC8639392.1 metallophosphoesterase [Caballeronia sp. EK]
MNQYWTAILLGAQDFNKVPDYRIGRVFVNSSTAFKKYLLDSTGGLGIEESNILDLFGSLSNATTQLSLIREHLAKAKLAASGFARTNLIVYYVGHGLPDFSNRTQELTLAIEDTEAAAPFRTSLRMNLLATELKEGARHFRRYVVLDCCYAGDAAIPFAPQSAMPSFTQKKIESAFFSAEIDEDQDDPRRGTGILAASDARTAAIAKETETYTRFSEALLRVLSTGHANLAQSLTLSDICDLTWSYLRINAENPHPFLSAPDAPEGDITTKVSIFPNAAIRQNEVDAKGNRNPSGSIKIVHMSDLHFGAPRQSSAWKGLVNYLRTLSPSLILATGDIADTPTLKDLTRAKKELIELGIPFKVCAGNTDRHNSGRLPRKLTQGKAASGRKSPKLKKASFDEIFKQHVVVHGEPWSESFRQCDYRWKLGIISVETSRDSKKCRQGSLDSEELTALVSAGGKVEDDIDICIALQHHQLLPIAELQVKSASAKGPAEASHPMMPNAGVLLDALTEAKVDLLLHGHEHRSFAARFTTVSHKRHEVTILSAGSATGASEFEPCKATNGSFNVIDLRPDGTVWLESHTCMAGNRWERNQETVSEIFSYRDMRRIKLGRSHTGVPTGKILKKIEFTATRDIRVREVRTPCYAKSGTFRHEVFNSTGTPTCNGITIEWEDGVVPQFLQPQYQKVKGTPHLWRFEVPLPRRASKITIDMIWESGCLLTADDSKLFDAQLLGPERIDGNEFVAARVEEGLEELTIILRVPEKVAPDVDSMEIIADKYPDWRDNSERTHPTSPPTRLRPVEMAKGSYVFTIPFPFTSMIYGLAWTLPRVARNMQTFDEFRQVVKSFGKALLEAFEKGLAPEFKDFASLGLYRSEGKLWELAAHVRGFDAASPPRGTAAVSNARSVYRFCWWGRTALSLRSDSGDDSNEDLDQDEVAVIAVPIRPPGAEDIFEPPGMLRIGFRKNLKIKNEEDLQKSMSESAVFLLNEFLQLRRQVQC